jgi:hypothetical protein
VLQLSCSSERGVARHSTRRTSPHHHHALSTTATTTHGRRRRLACSKSSWSRTHSQDKKTSIGPDEGSPRQYSGWTGGPLESTTSQYRDSEREVTSESCSECARGERMGTSKKACVGRQGRGNRLDLRKCDICESGGSLIKKRKLFFHMYLAPSALFRP